VAVDIGLAFREIREFGDEPRITKSEVSDSNSMQSQSPSRPKRSRTDPLLHSPMKKLKPRGLDEDERERTPKEAEPEEKPKQSAKKAHSLAEKRYRENLNAKTAELHRALQGVQMFPERDSDNTSDVKRDRGSSQARKIEVLTGAIDYVHQSQLELRHMTDDINRLTARVKALEAGYREELLKQSLGYQAHEE
jgi:hypothetical protein